MIGKQLCNAVILSMKNAAFLKRLRDSYQSFDQNCWDCHSVRLTGLLASIYPNEVVILPTDTFFRPSWNQQKEFFRSNDHNFSSSYAAHLWNKVNHVHLLALTPKIALSANNTFGRMLRQAIDRHTFIQLDTYFV